MHKPHVVVSILVSLTLVGCGANQPSVGISPPSDTQPPVADIEPAIPVTFTGFSTTEPDKVYLMSAIGGTFQWALDTGQVATLYTPETQENATVLMSYDSFSDLSNITYKAIGIVKDFSNVETDPITGTISALNQGGATLEIRLPSVAGLEYQTFGSWSAYASQDTGTVEMGVVSAGLKTSFADIPITGAYYFTGMYQGYGYGYESGPTPSDPYQIMGLVDLTANFSLKELTFLTHDSQLTNMQSGVNSSDSNIDLIGALKYTNSNSFSGSISAVNDAINFRGYVYGSFYGPTSSEVGGIFHAGGKYGRSDLASGYTNLTASFGAKEYAPDPAPAALPTQIDTVPFKSFLQISANQKYQMAALTSTASYSVVNNSINHSSNSLATVTAESNSISKLIGMSFVDGDTDVLTAGEVYSDILANDAVKQFKEDSLITIHSIKLSSDLRWIEEDDFVLEEWVYYISYSIYLLNNSCA